MILWPIKNGVRFEYIPWKNTWFCLISIVWVQCYKKTEIFDFESHWNIFVFFDKKHIVSDLNISHRKASDFVSLPLFGFTILIKLTNFDSENCSNALVHFNKKDILSDLNTQNGKLSDFVSVPLFRFRCPLVINVTNFDFEDY